MLELEVVVMVVGLRAESYLLDHYLGGLLFLFLLALLLLVEELLIVDHAAHGRLGRRRDLHEVELLALRDLEGLGYGIHALLDVVAHEAHLSGAYMLVGGIRVIAAVAAASALSGTRPRPASRAARAAELWFFLH